MQRDENPDDYEYNLSQGVKQVARETVLIKELATKSPEEGDHEDCWLVVPEGTDYGRDFSWDASYINPFRCSERRRVRATRVRVGLGAPEVG